MSVVLSVMGEAPFLDLLLLLGLVRRSRAAAGDANTGSMSQTKPIRPSRRIATAYLLEEVSILHARTRRGQIIPVTGRIAPGLTAPSSSEGL